MNQSAPLRDSMEALFRRKTLVLWGCGLFSIALLAFVLALPKTYDSQITFLVKSDRLPIEVSPYQSTAPAQAVDDTRLGTEMQLLQSQDLHREVLKAMLDKSGVAADSLSEADFNARLQGFEKSLHVVPVPKTSLIRATFTSSHREEAQETLRVLAGLYLNYHLKLHGSGGAYDFFGQQALLFQQKLAEAQSELTQFESKAKITVLSEQKDLELRKLTAARSALDETRTARLENDQRAAKLTHQLEQAKPRITTQKRTVPNQYSVDRMNTMLVELQNKRTDLLTKFKPTDRLVEEVDHQIADTRKALEQAQHMTGTEEATDVNPLRQSLDADLSKAEVNAGSLRARESGLQDQIRTYEQDLGKLDLATSEHDRLQQSVKDAQDNYQLYSHKREEARISGALDKEKIANVAIADGPTKPPLAKPRFTLATVCAFLLGNLFIAGFGVLSGMRHASVYAPWDLEAFTDIPVLATVPLERGLPMRGLSTSVELTVPGLAGSASHNFD